jgi:type III secretion protein T
MTDSYVSLFLQSAYVTGNLNSFLSIMFLFFARMLPIIALSPFFGARVLPNPTKVFFAITLFIIFLPALLLTSTKPLVFDNTLILYVLKELFVGFSLGFLISIPFIIFQCSGMLIDHQRGGASLMVNDPTIQNQSSPLGTMFNMVAIYIFYSIEGPFLFLDAIQRSYEIIPPDQFLNPNFFTKTSPFWKMEMQLLNEVMKIAIQIAAPALIAILMTDFFLGIANRLAPQVQVTFLGMPLKSLLGLAMICFGWFLMTDEFAKQLFHWINVVSQAVIGFQYGAKTMT